MIHVRDPPRCSQEEDKVGTIVLDNCSRDSNTGGYDDYRNNNKRCRKSNRSQSYPKVYQEDENDNKDKIGGDCDDTNDEGDDTSFLTPTIKVSASGKGRRRRNLVYCVF